MEDKIKIGEYVKYTGGYIDIVCEIVPEDYDETGYSEEHIKGKRNLFITYDRIQKHGKNILDLIEVGDYVNGLEVLDIYFPRDLWDTIEIRVNDKYVNFIIPDEINSIVTKEQFKNMEYKIEEDK